MPKKSARIVLKPKWPRHADVLREDAEYQSDFTHHHLTHRTHHANILQRVEEYLLRQGNDPLLPPMSRRRLATLCDNLIDWCSAVYQYRALYPPEERYLNLYRRQALIRFLVEELLEQGPPAALHPGNQTDAALNIAWLPFDAFFVKKDDDGTDMSYALLPKGSLDDVRAAQRQCERIVARVLAKKFPAKEKSPAKKKSPSESSSEGSSDDSSGWTISDNGGGPSKEAPREKAKKPVTPLGRSELVLFLDGLVSLLSCVN